MRVSNWSGLTAFGLSKKRLSTSNQSGQGKLCSRDGVQAKLWGSGKHRYEALKIDSRLYGWRNDLITGMKDNKACLGTSARNSSHTKVWISDLGLDCRGFESGFHCFVRKCYTFFEYGSGPSESDTLWGSIWNGCEEGEWRKKLETKKLFFSYISIPDER